MFARLALALPALLAVAPAAAAPDIQAGLWEITTRMDVAGMDAGVPPATIRHCIRPADLENPGALVPEGPRGNCRVADYRLEGDTASWRVECTGDAAMSGSARVTYAGGSYSGTMKIATRHEGRAVVATSRFSGRRVGDCR